MLCIIPAKAVRTPASSIRINVPPVGMQDAWENASSHVTPLVPRPVSEAAPIMTRRRAMGVTSPVMGKGAELDVPSTASAGVLECALGIAYRPAGILARTPALTTAAGNASPNVVADVNPDVLMGARTSALARLMLPAVWVDAKLPVSMAVTRTVLGSDAVLSVVSIVPVLANSTAESTVWSRLVPLCVRMHVWTCALPVLAHVDGSVVHARISALLGVKQNATSIVLPIVHIPVLPIASVAVRKNAVVALTSATLVLGCALEYVRSSVR